MLEKNLIPILLKRNKNLSPIKRGNCFLSLTIPELAFLDLKNYLAPNYLLALFLEPYGASESKGSFPYEKVKGVDDSSVLGLPSHNDFFSPLKGHILPEAYEALKQAWIENEISGILC